MKNQPIIPPGSCLAQPGMERSRFRTVVLVVVMFHVGILGGLLIQGCRNQKGQSESSAFATNQLAETVSGANQVSNSPSLITNAPSGASTIDTQSMATLTVPQSAVAVPVAANPPISELPIGTNANHQSASKPATHVSQTGTYLVARGDTLAKIAKAHHITIEALKEANGLRTDVIIAGKKLLLPQPHTASAK